MPWKALATGEVSIGWHWYSSFDAAMGSGVDFGIVRGESSGLSFLRRFKPVKQGKPLPIVLFFRRGEKNNDSLIVLRILLEIC